jgi:hypothetical protein
MYQYKRLSIKHLRRFNTQSPHQIIELLERLELDGNLARALFAAGLQADFHAQLRGDLPFEVGQVGGSRSDGFRGGSLAVVAIRGSKAFGGSFDLAGA